MDRKILFVFVLVLGGLAVPAGAYDWGVSDTSNIKSSPACKIKATFLCAYSEKPVTFRKIMGRSSDRFSLAEFITKNGLPKDTTLDSLAEVNKFYAIGYLHPITDGQEIAQPTSTPQKAEPEKPATPSQPEVAKAEEKTEPETSSWTDRIMGWFR